MLPLTTEWVAKAEGDFISATRELRARKAPNYDSACFHSQQCAEKYLKACLQEANVPFSRTHDLDVLLDLLQPIDAGWTALRPAAQILTSLAVDVRYPGYTADKNKAGDALRACRSVRIAARRSLGLTP
jgi:HEPN domain-containing protein